MREREKARIARLKARQDEKAAAQKRKEEKKFLIPPLQYERKDRQRPSSSIPTKPAMQKSGLSSTTPYANSTESSSSLSKGKRVSWASSSSTLEGNGCLYQKPLDDKRVTKTSVRPLPSFQPQKNDLGPLPIARPSIPRLSAYIAERAPRGQELIGAMSPDVARTWAQSDQQGMR